MKTKVTLGKVYKDCYTLQNGNTYSCLGFDVCIKRRNALAKELNKPECTTAKRGTIKAYKEYMKLVDIALNLHKATGFKSKSELTPQLIGFEGKRVEVTYQSGETERFLGRKIYRLDSLPFGYKNK